MRPRVVPYGYTMTITRRTLTAAALITATALALGACGSSKPKTTAEATTDEPTQFPTASATASSTPTVPGYRPGEIPPIPLFSLPAIDVFASNADKAVIDSASSQLSSVEGVTVSPAKCDGSSLISGSTIFGGDGSVVSSSANGTVVNAGDGSGTHTTRTVTVINNGDGTGSYTSPGLTIINNGDGTAQVNGQKVTDAPKVDKAAKLGKFPAVESLKPVESCGTLITLEDGVLFDFGKSEIRSDASQTLKKLAEVLNNAKVPAAHIYGHTDSISDDAFNQQLSEARANAVSGELKKDGVTATMDATGYGESKPVAPNENADGSDNPAGRALNRRVEIFIPAF